MSGKRLPHGLAPDIGNPMDDLPESDRLFDFPHPREQSELVGQSSAEQKLLTAYLSGKIHHGWILAGPRGIGKATLAYRLARFVLRHPDPAAPEARQAESLFVAPEDPVFKRVASGGHSDVFVVRRPYDQKAKRLRTEITVDTVRKATRFYTRTAGEGGWRICIVDPADDMNANAANAVLKVLEEPPDRALFILISHAPRRLLPTIRSRCINLPLGGLTQPDLETVVRRHAGEEALPPMDELHRLCRGSPGRALSLVRGKGWANFQEFQGTAGSLAQTRSQGLRGVRRAARCTRRRRRVRAVLRIAVGLDLLFGSRCGSGPRQIALQR